MEDKIKVLVDNKVITQEVADKYVEPFTIVCKDIIDQLLGVEVYPKPAKNIFRALNECPDPKVVILGQDPYFNIGQANGLAFDVNRDVTVPPSLRNILREMEDDLGIIEGYSEEGIEIAPSHLGHLPQQGVLLLNTALTVKPKEAGSHTEIWKPFTENLIKQLNSKDNIVWILWGNHAKSYKKYITNKTHHILEGVHPMPLAANRGGFFGCKYFSKANEFLKSTNQETINW